MESGGAIYINRVDRVLVKGCHFIENRVTLNGGAIYASDTVALNINVSVFNNNSAAYSYFNGGGAISVINGSIFTIDSHYINNRADIGGAIYVQSGNMCSTNDHYINNSGHLLGGAICVCCGNISSTSDHYINNSGRDGGAIYSYTDTDKNNIFTCTNNHYTNK